MFDFRLKVFYYVAKNLSFSKASRELYISQPAVTKHIKEIELQLAIRLFERKGNRISLTKAGEYLFKKTKNIFDIYEEIEYEIGRLRGEIKGKLKLGASSTISQWIIPEILSKFHAHYPSIEISLFSGNSVQVEEALLNNDIDLGIVEGNKKRKSLKYQFFKNDVLIPVIASNSKLSSYEKITVDEFLKLPLVLREFGSGTLDVILKELNEKYNLTIKDITVKMHLGSTESIKSYLYHSDVAAIISYVAVKKEIEAGLLKTFEIEGLNFTRKLRFVCPQGVHKKLNEKFISFAKRHFQL